ncbi:MAG TPA: DUF2203 domain-containing protein [Candidatus Acidoferrales bacterium]|nr:DUF2203 domain-containing protein [Candidatus Acidoferrales bacterium]
MGEEEREPKLFTLTEAERTRREVEPLLLEAIDCRRKMGELDKKLSQIANRIMLMGGVLVPYESTAKVRLERDQLAEAIKSALERIEATGCVVKDLDVGLLDFPALIDNEEVYLCWRLGEDRIRFWHRQDEGFAGRKLLDPRDGGPGSPIQ